MRPTSLLILISGSISISIHHHPTPVILSTWRHSPFLSCLQHLYSSILSASLASPLSPCTYSHLTSPPLASLYLTSSLMNSSPLPLLEPIFSHPTSPRNQPPPSPPTNSSHYLYAPHTIPPYLHVIVSIEWLLLECSFMSWLPTALLFCPWAIKAYTWVRVEK